jgi:hypothetical protein
MPIFDKSIQVQAPRSEIGAYIKDALVGTGTFQIIKDETLYVVVKDGLGFVYLLRPVPDSTETSIRLIGDEAQTIKSAFASGNPKDAMTQLVAAPPPDQTTFPLLPTFNRHVSLLQKRFDGFTELNNITEPASPPITPRPSTPRTPPLNTASVPPTANATAEEPRLNTPSTPPNLAYARAKEAPKAESSMPLLLGVGALAVVAVLAIIFSIGQAVTETVNRPTSTPTLFVYDHKTVKIAFPPGWVEKNNFSSMAGCNNVGFTCLVMADMDEGEVFMILGIYKVKSDQLDLGKLENDTWADVQQATGGKKIKENYFPISGTMGIRRYYTAPLFLGSQNAYVMQAYFNSPTTVYELMVAGLSEEAFNRRQKDINALIAAVKMK